MIGRVYFPQNCTIAGYPDGEFGQMGIGFSPGAEFHQFGSWRVRVCLHGVLGLRSLFPFDILSPLGLRSLGADLLR